VTADVVGAEHAFGRGLAGEPDHLRDRVAAADDQVASALAKRRPQVMNGLQQESGPVRRRPGAGQQPVIEDKERQHRRGPVRRGRQRRVVVQPQVAGEQHDGQAHGSHTVLFGPAAPVVARFTRLHGCTHPPGLAGSPARTWQGGNRCPRSREEQVVRVTGGDHA
jgi:hypothetical protein